jgi:hypothetical protein
VTNRAIEQNEKSSYQLIRFTWNEDGQVGPAGEQNYTDWTSEITDDEGFTYEPRPTMEVKIPKNTGDLGDETLTIDMTLEEGFLTDMTNGLPHATVTCTVSEISRPTSAGPQRSTSVTFQGTVVLATRNANGRRNNVRLTAKTPKALTAGVAIGQPCNIQCGNNFGDARCGLSLALGANAFFVTIQAINGRTITTSVPNQLNPSAKYFHRGWIRYGGLRIMIRDWNDSAPTTFVLVRQPPAEWLGKSVLATSGCDKSVETCRDRYDNEEHFNGPGFAMPGYLPIFESA